MTKHSHVIEIVRALLSLPPERLAEVREYVLSLQQLHGQAVDESEHWTDEDVRDLVAASLEYAGETLQEGEFPDGQAQ